MSAIGPLQAANMLQQILEMSKSHGGGGGGHARPPSNEFTNLLSVQVAVQAGNLRAPQNVARLEAKQKAKPKKEQTGEEKEKEREAEERQNSNGDFWA